MRVSIFRTLLVPYLALGQTAYSSQSSAEKAPMLETMGILPYPEQPQSELPSELIKIQPIRAKAIDINFANLNDLTWLKPIATKNRVFVLEERRCCHVIHPLARRWFFALNTFDHYGLLTIEDQFSYSPFYDYYISVADHHEATVFREKVLGPFC